MATIPSENIETIQEDELFRKTEGELINIGNWALNSLKIPGYFPLKIRNPSEDPELNSKSGLKPSSFENPRRVQVLKFDPYFCYILFWCMASFIVDYFRLGFGYDIIVQLKEEDRRVFSDGTDKLVYTYNGFILTLVSNLFRIAFLIKSRKVLESWTDTVNLLSGFENLGLFKDSSYFQEIRWRVRKLGILFWAFAFGQIVLGFLLLVCLQYFVGIEDKFAKPLLWIVSLFILYFHMGFIIWIGFFIKIYIACFRTISKGIRDIVEVHECLESSQGNALVHFEAKVSQGMLIKLLDLYEQTCEEIEKFNCLYGIPLILECLICISSLLTCIFTMNKLMFEVEGRTWEINFLSLLRLPPQLVFIVKLVFLTTHGSLVTDEGLKVLRSLQKMPGKIVNEDLQLHAKIQTLVTRMSVHQPGIYPMNMFPLNKKLLASIVSLLVTYIVVLGEIREEDEGRAMIRKLIKSCKDRVS